MPAFEDTRRIKSFWICHDRDNLFVMLEIKPGVRERFEKKKLSGHIAYFYLDSDAGNLSGARRHISDEYPGWDYRIYLPEGFIKSESVSIQDAKPVAWYKAERIKNYNEIKADYGVTFNCEYENLAGGERSTYNNPEYISFKGDFIEMRFPFKVFNIKLPADIRLIIEDLNSLPSVEARINGKLSE